MTGVAHPAGGAPESTGAATEPRDRVLDAVKAFALVVVIVGHALAWDVTTDTPANVVDSRPHLAWVTWVIQVLPLFFAVGAVSNLGSWRRRPDRDAFRRRRLLRLGAPALVYGVVWTAVLLPLAAFFPFAELAGEFLATLTWFMGVYSAIVLAVPWTSGWARRPLLTLGLWLGAIVVVDVARFTVAPIVGWLNLLLVWGWLHQLGYHLPALRRRPAGELLGLAAVAFALAVGLAYPGPYSSPLVTFAADAERSNFTPPTVLIAVFGLTQVLVLAAVYPWLSRVLARERVWRAVGAVAARAVDLYLWHIAWVGAIGATAWAAGFRPVSLGGAWWAAHVVGLAVVFVGTWFTAGVARHADLWVVAWGLTERRRRLPALPFALLTTAALLLATVTGYGTWWGRAMFLGIPTSTLIAVPLLALGLRALAVGGPAEAHLPHAPTTGRSSA